MRRAERLRGDDGALLMQQVYRYAWAWWTTIEQQSNNDCIAALRGLVPRQQAPGQPLTTDQIGQMA